jgi:hypothetical protein
MANQETIMIPSKTLRERLTEALVAELRRLDEELGYFGEEEWSAGLAEAAIRAIGDPCLIKTADSLEPTFTLRAQDRCSDILVRKWVDLAAEHGYDGVKLLEAIVCADHMAGWQTRKWPD